MNQKNKKNSKEKKPADAQQTKPAAPEASGKAEGRRPAKKQVNRRRPPRPDGQIFGTHDILGSPELDLGGRRSANEERTEEPTASAAERGRNGRGRRSAKNAGTQKPAAVSTAVESLEPVAADAGKKESKTSPAEGGKSGKGQRSRKGSGKAGRLSGAPAETPEAPRRETAVTGGKKKASVDDLFAFLDSREYDYASDVGEEELETPVDPLDAQENDASRQRRDHAAAASKGAAKKSKKTTAAEKARDASPAGGNTAGSAADAADKEPKKTQSRRAGRGNAGVVSAEDSIVVDADVLRHEGNTLRVRSYGGKDLRYVPKTKLRIIPLGGLNEIGKNMTVVEYGDDIIIIDCGIGFPDEEEMPGIDLVIPDVTYLEQNADRIRGMVLTHGHEDHIGAIPYVLQKICPPIYATRLTLGIIENKLQEHTLPWKADLRCVQAGDVIRLGASFTVEFVHVNHSIADACALAINTPLGMLIHTGDFKLDLTPIEGEMMNITRLGELGRDGVLLMMCESTNAERPGHTPSEKKVGQSLEMIFTMNPDKRIVIATFSSNVHRVQQIIDTSARHGRKVAVTGRSMINIVAAAVQLGYMKVPDGVLIDINDIRKYRPDQLTLVTTGSQGEPMSALYRMAFGDHNQVTLGQSDLVVLSASAIPGNEKLVGRIINELSKMGVHVINDSSVEVHVSGHACQEELKLMQGLTRPRYLMPVHGEYKHLAANRELGMQMGIPSDHIFISDIGKVLEIDETGAKWGGTVPSGVVLIDGYGVGDVGNIVLRDRKHLSQDGLIVVVATVDANAGLLVSGPDIVSRGFVYVRESEGLMEEVRRIAADAIQNSLNRSGCDWYEIKNRIKDDIAKYLYTHTKRKPMILPIVMDV